MVVTVAELKQHLNLSEDLGTDDDALLARILAASQRHIESQLGFKLADRYGATGLEDLPADLPHAVTMLAAHWYENREASLVGISAQALPFGVNDIVSSYREWSF